MKIFLTACICLILFPSVVFLKSQSSKSILLDQWFDSYGVIPWEEEIARLDNFASYLERHPAMNGYIAFYVGENDKYEEIKLRIDKAKKYLACERKIAEGSIIIVDAGKRDKVKIILQPVSKGSSPPEFQ